MPDPAVRRDIEAVLFAAGRPVSPNDLLFAASHARSVEMREVEEALAELASLYPIDGERGMEIAWTGGGWVLRTNRRAKEALSALFDRDVDSNLSAAALEVLAVIAYLQPISRPEITEIRGVNSDSTVQRLLERDLVVEVGRSEGPGTALLYGTTKRFEVMFGLAGLENLPPLEEFEPSVEDRNELRRRLGVTPAPE